MKQQWSSQAWWDFSNVRIAVPSSQIGVDIGHHAHGASCQALQRTVVSRLLVGGPDHKFLGARVLEMCFEG